MIITFKVSQALKQDDGKAYPILPTLFEVEPMILENVTELEFFTSNLINFQKHLKIVFDKIKYPHIFFTCDEVLAKIDFCVDFKDGAFERNHKFSTPLTLFIEYDENSIKDVSVHIFLALIEKWQDFYKISQERRGI